MILTNAMFIFTEAKKPDDQTQISRQLHGWCGKNQHHSATRQSSLYCLFV